MEPDIVLGDLQQCATCGCRRMVPRVAAAATGRDALRALFEEVLVDLQSTWLASSASSSDREIIQDDIDDYRARLAALLGRV